MERQTTANLAQSMLTFSKSSWPWKQNTLQSCQNSFRGLVYTWASLCTVEVFTAVSRTMIKCSTPVRDTNLSAMRRGSRSDHSCSRSMPGFHWKENYLLLIYWRFIAQSTAQGQLSAFHKFKSSTSWIQYKTCTLHKRKTCKHNPKVSPFGIALVKNGKKS